MAFGDAGLETNFASSAAAYAWNGMVAGLKAAAGQKQDACESPKILLVFGGIFQSLVDESTGRKGINNTDLDELRSMAKEAGYTETNYQDSYAGLGSESNMTNFGGGIQEGRIAPLVDYLWLLSNIRDGGVFIE